ncbi:hypothetical protein PSHT_01818 [Puccinia striiformis]|uniref:Secreted protein n=3 Tax=Puccinia striiformis TaxID=27350 RepID=A0A0L0VBH7_9BASI|nr:hypothetical protein PSTG_10037 [Puccinia striiformis f. sp. tritici PST-78]POW07915.1 hypothetical protein PSTT_07988 [Puccinia striiformis]POW21922.1 hypothetical protein PSHT_01818 [Puccinia striiformis]
MKRVKQWILACITLHNMLAQLGDAWGELASSINSNDDSGNDVGDVDEGVGTACGTKKMYRVQLLYWDSPYLSEDRPSLTITGGHGRDGKNGTRRRG